MTINEERISAVSRTRQFLLDLLDPQKTPRVPRSIRKQSYSLLRHFPTEYDATKAWPPQFRKSYEP
jgi:hypothetical protein